MGNVVQRVKMRRREGGGLEKGEEMRRWSGKDGRWEQAPTVSYTEEGTVKMR